MKTYRLAVSSVIKARGENTTLFLLNIFSFASCAGHTGGYKQPRLFNI